MRNFLIKNYKYSLITYEGNNPLVQFLISKRKGDCEYFATALAILLRTVGIPSRLVVGFTNEKYNPKNKICVVTSQNAHAWVEVYFPDVGWLTCNATPGKYEEAEDAFSEQLLKEKIKTPALEKVLAGLKEKIPVSEITKIPISKGKPLSEISSQKETPIPQIKTPIKEKQSISKKVAIKKEVSKHKISKTLIKKKHPTLEKIPLKKKTLKPKTTKIPTKEKISKPKVSKVSPKKRHPLKETPIVKKEKTPLIKSLHRIFLFISNKINKIESKWEIWIINFSYDYQRKIVDKICNIVRKFKEITLTYLIKASLFTKQSILNTKNQKFLFLILGIALITTSFLLQKKLKKRKKRKGLAIHKILNTKKNKDAKLVTSFYHQILHLLSKIGYIRPLNITPREFATQLSSRKLEITKEIEILTEFFYRTSFGAITLTNVERKTIKKNLENIKIWFKSFKK
jgi:hypothetical protein